MSRVWRVAAVFAGLILAVSPSVAAAQDVDPIGTLLEQSQTPRPSDAMPTAPGTQGPAAPVSAPPVQTPALEAPPPAQAPFSSAPVVTAPPITTGPPPAAYTPPPLYSRPAAVQAPLPYVNSPPVYPQPPYVPPPPRRQLTAPVHIDETGKTPEGPPTATDLNFEARMRSSFNSAQGMQGPLDGAWSLKAGGTELYDLQLVDTGSGSLEGAWRDPRRRGAVDASGFIDVISRVGGQLTIRITSRPGADPSIILLSADGNGGWSGELTERGEHRSVTLRRN